MLFILFNLFNVTLTASSSCYDEFSSFKQVLTGNPNMNEIMERCKSIHKNDDKEHIQLLLDIGSYVGPCKWFSEITFEREEKFKNKKQLYTMLIDVLNYELLQMMHINLQENNSLFIQPNDNSIEEGSYFYTKSILLSIFNYCMRMTNKRYSFNMNSKYYAVEMCVGLRELKPTSIIDVQHNVICQKILSIDLHANQSRKNNLIAEIIEKTQ